MAKRKRSGGLDIDLNLVLFIGLLLYGNSQGWFNNLGASSTTIPTTTTTLWWMTTQATLPTTHATTQATSQATTTTTLGNSRICFDSDFGKNFLTWGYCEDPVNLIGMSDKCTSGLNLVEYYCNLNRCAEYNTMCTPPNVCVNGRCVPQSPTTTTTVPSGDAQCDALCKSQGYSYGGYDGGWVSCEDFEHYISGTPCCCHTLNSLGGYCQGTLVSKCADYPYTDCNGKYMKAWTSDEYYYCVWDESLPKLCYEDIYNTCVNPV